MKQTRKIVVIMTDTQRWDMVGCYGNKDMKTPNLNKLAEEGMRFERAYTTQPVCGPARAGIFTGLYPHSCGSWTNSMPLGDNVKTIGQRLRDNGLHTAYVGKWHLDGGDYFGVGLCPDGWDPDYWYDMRCYLEELTEDERQWSRNAQMMKERHVLESFTFGHRSSNKAIDFIQKSKDEDFFLVVSYDEPHHPYICPEPYSSMYQDYEFPKSRNIWDTLDTKPEHQKIWAGNSTHEDKENLVINPTHFLGCNSYIDYEIGRVLSTIEAYAPDALVIYTSDHGDFLSSHSLSGKGPAVYDEITRIPFIVKWPGVVTASSVYASPVSHIDIAPTIMQAAGLAVPKILEGKSLMQVFKDPSIKVNDAIFMEFGRYEVDHDGFGGFQPLRAVFNGRYKLVINLLSGDELYDISEDPDEMVNLIYSQEHYAIRDSLHNQLLDWMNETRDPFRGYYWEQRPWKDNHKAATWSYTGMTRQRENEEYEPRQLDYSTGLDILNAVRKK